MRIWLEKGKQKELLLREKELKKTSWSEFAKVLNVSFGRLNSWVYEENLMPEEIFNQLRLKSEYQKFIIHKLEDNWGRIKGGKMSSGNLKSIKIPAKDEMLAEFWGIMLGDGNVQRTTGYKLGTYNIKIVGHAILDRDYLLNFVKPLGKSLFKVSPRVYDSKLNLGMNVVLDGRRIVDFFEDGGFAAGDKLKNQVGIPDWIKESEPRSSVQPGS